MELTTILQIVLSVLLIILILLQSRGAGLGSAFGGGGEFYSTRRGIERILLWLTVGVAALFMIISVLSVI